ncbi:lipooligosaccharide transport system ATP-binding protein [Nocardiopsis sp. Huas11]|uniref:ABC transporter ATP-binding protein n=1 Tax=Nocardiopsis sp. Huas11 TaxID=2183912 RepID=UPI000EADA407|nr:ABC transporter ATP-binding protein [Nocardiopsis sp. Huas11]RKS10828.1 lipooligosaccharide transport system ATP-binding protein [Nocardiopsis sp. Huas11]
MGPSDSSAVPALLLRGVVKRFGSLTAVDGLDLDVPQGVVLGLLGPNGAGKSTTMKMLTAQSLADEGEIRILGHEIPAESKWARARMGVVPQHDNLDEELTVEQNLRMFSFLYRVPRRRRREAIARAMRLAQLGDRGDTLVDDLSGGMRRRLLIVRALLHRPELVLMDEPTVGLDPQVRQDLWGVINALRAEGVTVLMSTHYIEEAERLSDEVALMAAGRVVERGTPADLVAKYAGATVEEYEPGDDGIDALETLIRDHGFTTRRTGTTVSVLRAEELPESLRDRLDTPLRRASNLEDVFVTLTGESVE